MNSIVSEKAVIREMESDELLAIFERDKTEYHYNRVKLEGNGTDNMHDFDCYHIFAPNMRLIERDLKPIIDNYRQLTGITLSL